MAKALELTCQNREYYNVATRNSNKKKDVPKMQKPPVKLATNTKHPRPGYNAQKQQKQSPKPSLYLNPRQRSGRCGNCFEYNHETKDCGFRGQVVCRHCSERGHKQKFCHEVSRDFNNYKFY